MLDHPTHDQLRSLKLDGMADAFAELQGRDDTTDLSHAEWLGLLIDREAASRGTKKVRPGCALPGCAMSGPASRTWITEPRGSSTGPCSRTLPPASGSTNAATC